MFLTQANPASHPAYPVRGVLQYHNALAELIRKDYCCLRIVVTVRA
jgi:hypothetical protein